MSRKKIPAGHAACTALIPWESWDLMTATQSLVKEFQSLVKELWGTLLVVFTKYSEIVDFERFET